jgi:hypothetical protein
MMSSALEQNPRNFSSSLLLRIIMMFVPMQNVDRGGGEECVGVGGLCKSKRMCTNRCAFVGAFKSDKSTSDEDKREKENKQEHSPEKASIAQVSHCAFHLHGIQEAWCGGYGDPSHTG